jgi:hypothetical protein
MMSAEYPGIPATNQHQLMISLYLTQMQEAMLFANGGLGGGPNGDDPSIFLGPILAGFPDQLAYIQQHLGFTGSDILNMVNTYNTWRDTNIGGQFVNRSPNGVWGLCGPP